MKVVVTNAAAVVGNNVRRDLNGQDADTITESAWDEEIKHRIADIDSGAATLIPAQEVFIELRRLINT